jgi:hypothetical protein
MDDTKRHIVEDYPAERLPDDLRGAIDPTHRARIIVEDISTPAKAAPRRFLRYFGAAKHRDISIDAAVKRIRTLRDEWGE